MAMDDDALTLLRPKSTLLPGPGSKARSSRRSQMRR